MYNIAHYFYGIKNWSCKGREEQRIRIFRNMVLLMTSVFKGRNKAGRGIVTFNCNT